MHAVSDRYKSRQALHDLHIHPTSQNLNKQIKEVMKNHPTNVVNTLVTGRFNGHSSRQNQPIVQVLMFPWLAHGHISPYLELAKKLSNTQHFIIYFCSTPVNLTSIKKKFNGEIPSSIKFVELHLEESTLLPSCFHTTNGLPPHLMDNLKQALKSSIPNFISILKALKPDLLIYDSIQPWAADAAKEMHIPVVDFITSSTVSTCFNFHLFKNPQGKGDDFPFIDSIYYHEYEKHHLEKVIGLAHIEKESSIECIEKSDIVLIKGMKDVEGKYCDYLSELCGNKIMLVGSLVQKLNQEDENNNIIKWLNKKGEKSTIFISFGSEYFLSDEEWEEIARGLELTKVNFVWVVRFPKDAKNKYINLEDSLPEGFLARVGDRGLVVEGWAPQLKILEHPSIDGFVSHCGWSSTMESMKYGVPIIAMLMHLDQPVNSRLVEESGFGIEVLRSYNGKLLKEKLAESIEKVVMKEEGRFVKEKAKNMSEMIALKGDEDMDAVVKELMNLTIEKKMSKKNRFYDHRSMQVGKRIIV